MTNDDLFDFDNSAEPEMEGTETEATEEVVEVEEPEIEAEATEVPAETEEPMAPQVEAIEEPKDEPSTVPLEALRQERERAKQYREQVENYQRAEQEREQARLASNMPDPIDDPQAYHDYVINNAVMQIEERNKVAKFESSVKKAQETYGQEYLDDLADFVSQTKAVDPTIEAKAMAAPDPVEYVIGLKKRQELMKNVEADPDAWVKQRAIELGLIPMAQAQPTVVEQATPAVPKMTGPRSLANAPATSRTNKPPSIDPLFE